MGDELINPNTGLPLGASFDPWKKAWDAVTAAPGLTTATGNTPWGSTWGRVPTILGNSPGTYSTTLPYTSGTSNVNLSGTNTPNNYWAAQKEWLDSEGLWGIKNGNWGQIATVGQLGLGAFNLWNAYQANKINKQQLAFQRDSWNKQYQTSLGSYLNQYNDILNSRAAMYGLTGDDATSYVDSQLANVENRLKTGTAATTNPNIRRDLDNDLGA